ncbi:MAG: class I SAM-dependent methyltransferase [bacterium]|nr:class I SAM-dependent methyltransferase [bacterium]
MKGFADSVIKPYLAEHECRTVCEVGAQFGENTVRLLQVPDVTVTVIDPCLDADLPAKVGAADRVVMRPGLSLEILPSLEGPFDCILLDGDHNWYTVYNELRIIRERGLLRPGGAIFLHDVCWPYARRDMYYQPDTIPVEYRHPHACKGIVKGQSELCGSQGEYAHVHNAVMEGGPRNGVLTAVEDLLSEHGRDYLFFRIEAQYGLGVLFRKGDAAANRQFRRFRARVLRRMRVGRMKDTLQARFPRLYSVAKRLAGR